MSSSTRDKMAHARIGFPHLFLLLFYANFSFIDCLQCYSCKGSGSNEIEANIECLQKAYLEQCEEFYDYYNEVEDSDYNQYDDDYYYNEDEENIEEDAGYIYPDDEAEVGVDHEDDGEDDTRSDFREAKASSRERSDRDRVTTPSRVSVDEPAREEDEVEIEPKPRPRPDLEPPTSRGSPAEPYNRGPNNRGQNNPPFVPGGNVYRGGASEPYLPPGRLAPPIGRRQRRASKLNSAEYEYEYYDEPINTTNSASHRLNDDHALSARDRDDNDHDSAESKQNEHYCYSMTQKVSWESYTVEKGCKKIIYCEAALKNKPEWTHPWNFCCSRSRCNVKLVKDKPQRVYGMGCRRTDDCIQGHSSRPVCPQFFKQCPRVSHSLIKMECRTNARTMASVKNLAKYRHLYRDKKCYCEKGYFPKGPICTNGSPVAYAAYHYLSFISLLTVVYIHL